MFNLVINYVLLSNFYAKLSNHYVLINNFTHHNRLERSLWLRYLYPPFLLQTYIVPTNLPTTWLTYFWTYANLYGPHILASVVVSVDLEPQRTLVNFHEPNNHGEGVTRKRTLENQDERIRTNITSDGGNLPTKLPTICLNVINLP